VTQSARYRDRADRLRLVMEAIDDPIARLMLAALADAFEEAAAEHLHDGETAIRPFRKTSQSV
jgi:hypothetical protein